MAYISLKSIVLLVMVLDCQATLALHHPATPAIVLYGISTPLLTTP
jgi:hypothetical protein